MSKPIKFEDLGLTSKEAELLAKGARHLFGDPTTDSNATTDSTPEEEGALSGVALKGSRSARQGSLS